MPKLDDTSEFKHRNAREIHSETAQLLSHSLFKCTIKVIPKYNKMNICTSRKFLYKYLDFRSIRVTYGYEI